MKLITEDPVWLWHQKHGLTQVDSPVVGVPNGDDNEFYLKLERWPNKIFLPGPQEEKLVQFLKLWKELFYGPV